MIIDGPANTRDLVPRKQECLGRMMAEYQQDAQYHVSCTGTRSAFARQRCMWVGIIQSACVAR